MSRLTASQVYAYAVGAGLSSDAAMMATAIAGWAGSPHPGESGGDTQAVGDTALEDAKWGPSVGLWQIRSLRSEKMDGTSRDYHALFNPEHNAKSMYEISSGGTNWQPWSIYKAGLHEQNLKALRSSDLGKSLTDPGWSVPLVGSIDLPFLHDGFVGRFMTIVVGLVIVVIGGLLLSSALGVRPPIPPQLAAIRKLGK